MVGDWNIRVKERDGKTVINLNLVNLDCYYLTSYGMTKVPIRSTGVFEQGLLKYLSE